MNESVRDVAAKRLGGRAITEPLLNQIEVATRTTRNKRRIPALGGIWSPGSTPDWRALLGRLIQDPRTQLWLAEAGPSD